MNWIQQTEAHFFAGAGVVAGAGVTAGAVFAGVFGLGVSLGHPANKLTPQSMISNSPSFFITTPFLKNKEISS